MSALKAFGVRLAGMVQSILRLGDSVQVATPAEGIETDAQLRELRELGCAYGPG